MKLLDELEKRFEIPNDRQLASKLGLSHQSSAVFVQVRVVLVLKL